MTRRLMAPPTLNLDVIERDIAAKLKETAGDGIEILTQSQVALSEAEARTKDLERANEMRRVEIGRTKKAIADLSTILERQEALESDGEVELHAQLSLIDSLRKAGIKLPASS